MFRPSISELLRTAVITAVVLGCAIPAYSQIVPGTGRRLDRIFDNFEDEEWEYKYNLPKSSHEQDGRMRGPLAYSANGMWAESGKRGTPDYVARVETPPGGLPGSKGALMIRTLNSGIPERIGGEPQQDDLIYRMANKAGSLSASAGPNVVVRLWIPPFDEFEKRTSSHFGIRLALSTTVKEKKGRWIFKRTVSKRESYWPGMFVQYFGADRGHSEPKVNFVIRGADNGGDFPGPQITRSGWWTVGMSVTPDGRVHYYAREGVEDLRPQDKIASTTPYGYQAESMSTLFFNITSRNDGRTWSTPFIIDDPMIFRAY